MKALGFKLFFAQFFLLSSLALVSAQDKSAPDDTKINQRDRNSDAPTADQQKENESDRKITQNIRQALMNDKSLSTYGQNVKIVTQNGAVTLKGPVRSEDEKRIIEDKAKESAGTGKVDSQLEITPSK